MYISWSLALRPKSLEPGDVLNEVKALLNWEYHKKRNRIWTLIKHFSTFKWTCSNITRKIKTNKATGPDVIPAWILIDFVYVLAPPMATIFNISLREGIIPSTAPANINRKHLLPISLTHIVAMVFETIVVNWWIIPDISNGVDTIKFGSIAGTSGDAT